jgi:hypothetical protein
MAYPETSLRLLARLHSKEDYEGHVAFTAKRVLIEHYKKSLGAKRFWANNMLLETKEALRLVRRYFKDFDDTRL